MAGNQTVQRSKIVDYLNVGSAETPDYKLMGRGFNTLDESPSAQTDTKTYINDDAASSVIKGYQPQFPFDSDLIASEEAVMALYDIGRNYRTGEDAELDYVRMEIFKKVTGKENTFEARKFRVSVEVSSISGGGGETVKVTGNLNNVGTFVPGEFNTVTRTFTPAGDAADGGEVV